MKSITIIGNLGANAVMRTATDGRQLMTFNVAVSQVNADPVWFNCIGSMREKLFQYLVKGQCVCVFGDLQASDFNGRIDLLVYIDRIELCGARPDEKKEEVDGK